MSKVKKLLAIVLTLAMTIAMGMTSFAAEGTNKKISVSGTGISEATVTYAQIVVEDRASTQGWKFTTAAEEAFVRGWNSVESTKLTAVQVMDELIAAGILECGPNDDQQKYNVNAEAGKITTNAKFSAALAAVESLATTSTTAENDAKVFTAPSKGLYVIKAVKTGVTYLPMAAYMNTAGQNVAVVAKGTENYITKKLVNENDSSINPGDEIEYTVETPYIFIKPEATKTFTVTDTLTNATFKQNTVIVKIGQTTLKAGTYYTINEYAGTTGLTIDFGAKYNANYAGQILTITYTAVADENITAASGVENRVGTTNATGKIVENKPVTFTVIKTNDNDVKLGGATFQLYKDVPQDTEGAIKLKVGAETKYGLPWGDAKVTSSDGSTKGTATWDNLDAQDTYYVKETNAPEGYSLNNTVYVLSGASAQENQETTWTDTTNNVTYSKTTYTYTNFNNQTVVDTKLSALPSTGGIGTTIFTIGGCVIMIAAAGLFFASRKKK